jgi:hypothetical protein
MRYVQGMYSQVQCMCMASTVDMRWSVCYSAEPVTNVIDVSLCHTQMLTASCAGMPACFGRTKMAWWHAMGDSGA